MNSDGPPFKGMCGLIFPFQQTHSTPAHYEITAQWTLFISENNMDTQNLCGIITFFFIRTRVQGKTF